MNTAVTSFFFRQRSVNASGSQGQALRVFEKQFSGSDFLRAKILLQKTLTAALIASGKAEKK